MNTFTTTQLLKCAILAGSLIMPAVSWADDHLLSVNGATVTTPAIVTHAGPLTQPLVLSNFDGNTTLTFGQSQTLTVVSAPVKMCKPGTNKQLEWLDQGNTVVGVTGVLTSGTSPSGNDDDYRLTLNMTGISDTYGSANGACTVNGAKTYIYTASAVIDNQNGTNQSGTNQSGNNQNNNQNGNNQNGNNQNGNNHNGTNQSGNNQNGNNQNGNNQNGNNQNGNSGNYTNKLTTTYNFWNATNSIPEPGTVFLLLIGLLGLGWMSMTRKRQMHGASA